jgi:hypothetical protein
MNREVTGPEDRTNALVETFNLFRPPLSSQYNQTTTTTASEL